ncbi:MAG: ABC transporter ATP-binding protein [Brevinema sp.]
MSNIIIKNLSHHYTINKEQFFALKKVNINFTPDQIHVILGHSGAGKTTLLRLISGLEKPSDGTIIFSDLRFGMVFQEPRLMPWLTVEENIRFWDHDKTKSSEILLKEMKLYPFRTLYPDQLSGGMAQKTSLARALFSNPNTLLMDEPFASLDYLTRHHLQKLLLKIQKERSLRIIFITHSIDEAIILADHIYIMNKGYLEHSLMNTLNPQERENSQKAYELKTHILSLIDDLSEERCS